MVKNTSTKQKITRIFGYCIVMINALFVFWLILYAVFCNHTEKSSSLTQHDALVLSAIFSGIVYFGRYLIKKSYGNDMKTKPNTKPINKAIYFIMYIIGYGLIANGLLTLLVFISMFFSGPTTNNTTGMRMITFILFSLFIFIGYSLVKKANKRQVRKPQTKKESPSVSSKQEFESSQMYIKQDIRVTHSYKEVRNTVTEPINIVINPVKKEKKVKQAKKIKHIICSSCGARGVAVSGEQSKCEYCDAILN